MVKAFAVLLMSAEADALCGAAWASDPTREPTGETAFDTRAGTIELQVPKVRTGSSRSEVSYLQRES